MADGYLHIAVAVIRDAANRILISERKQDCAYAGQWEFPGGKVEAGESVTEALVRELDEELGLEITAARPLIKIAYEYPDRKVLLDTWLATAWSGAPESREGQKFTWVTPGELDACPMLAANQPIVRAAQLPDEYLFTPDSGKNTDQFLSDLNASLVKGVELVRLRQPDMPRGEYATLAELCKGVCDAHGTSLMVDDLALAQSLSVGLHLNSSALRQFSCRPIAENLLLAASCHDAQDFQRAKAIACDFAVLGAVLPTSSHPGVSVLGWEGFAGLIKNQALPVYALGGMTTVDKTQAWASGGQGIAAISGLWASR